MYISWTEHDDEFLRILYLDNKLKYQEVKDYFPSRSLSAIRGRIKFLKLSRYTRLDKPLLGKHLSVDININTLFPLNTQLNCYVYGLLVTDGCIMKNRLSFNSIDKELVDIVHESIGYGRVYRRNGKYKIWQFEFPKRRISIEFSKIGLKERKSKILDWNDLIKNVPVEFHRDFIRGLWDGDGSTYLGADPQNHFNRRFMISFCSASRNMIYPMLEYVRKNVIKTSISVYSYKNRDMYEFGLSYSNARIFCKWMYTNSGKYRLERKFQNYFNFIKK